MVRNIAKHKSIYLFISVLATIGFFTGFFFYKVQNNESKTYIKESIDIKENLSTGNNKIFITLKKSLFIFICSIFVIPQVINITKIFFEPFEIGFIFSFLLSYNFTIASIYTIFYNLISLIILFILIRISISISYNIIKFLLYREKTTFKHLKRLCLKYFILTSILLLYEIIISIFSTNINSYLMTFL